jgi:hypothetical protein
LPILSITDDLTPDVPLFVNADARSAGRNSLALAIIALFDSELFSSLDASERNCLSKTALRAPVLDDSSNLGIMSARFLRQV